MDVSVPQCHQQAATANPDLAHLCVSPPGSKNDPRHLLKPANLHTNARDHPAGPATRAVHAQTTRVQSARRNRLNGNRVRVRARKPAAKLRSNWASRPQAPGQNRQPQSDASRRLNRAYRPKNRKRVVLPGIHGHLLQNRGKIKRKRLLQKGLKCWLLLKSKGRRRRCPSRNPIPRIARHLLKLPLLKHRK